MEEKTKPRRSKGEGALRKRKDGKWEGRLTIGYDESGKQLLKTVYGKTKQECVNKLNELKKFDFSTQTYANADKTTYSLWLDYWLMLRKGQLAPKTEQDYKRYINTYIRPSLGQIKLDQINHNHIESCLNDIKNPKAGEKQKSQRLLGYVYFLLKTTLEAAVTKELILRNPCNKVEKPKNDPIPKGVPSEDEVYKIIESAYEKYQLFYETAWETGARRSEILALRYRDLDFKEPAIYVKDSAYWDEELKKVVIKKTKNEDSKRKILISKYLLDKLAGNPRRISGYIFIDENSEFFKPHNLSSAFTTAVKRAGFDEKEYSLHSLRHAHAHALLKNKIPMEVVQNRLGHATIDITIATYGHINSSFQQGIPELMDSLRKVK